MGVLEKLNVGIVGAASRGGTFRAALEANGARVHAVCDTNADELAGCKVRLHASEAYDDYPTMLERSELDAVVIGTPMQLHVPQSTMALDLGLSVLCEVPAGVSIDECRTLVLSAKQSKGVYMMAENYCYTKPNVLIRELVRHGLFGQTYYAVGEYLHELKAMFERTTWRRHWQAGIDGITYGTHSLGPVLQWMPGDRVARVCCEASGQHYRDPRGAPYAQDTPVMLAKTAKGALIKIRIDILSDRPHAMTNYQLQGTDGAYESSRGGPFDRSKIWLRSLCAEPKWADFYELMHGDLGEHYLPHSWRNPPPEIGDDLHGGGDYFEVVDFLNAVRGNNSPAVGIHEAMDMTLPGLVSQESIRHGGEFRPVPDSREWALGIQSPQLRMRWPVRAAKPAASLSSEYELRQFRDADETDYIALMTTAGFTGWSHESVDRARRAILPGGFFVVAHLPSGKLVATATAVHRPAPDLPYSGELSWVAADPEHSGQGLGRAVSSAVVGRFLDAGYRSIYLLTDDHRLSAIKVYLQLGFEPDVLVADAEARWKRIEEQLTRSRGPGLNLP